MSNLPPRNPRLSKTLETLASQANAFANSSVELAQLLISDQLAALKKGDKVTAGFIGDRISGLLEAAAQAAVTVEVIAKAHNDMPPRVEANSGVVGVDAAVAASGDAGRGTASGRPSLDFLLGIFPEWVRRALPRPRRVTPGFIGLILLILALLMWWFWPQIRERPFVNNIVIRVTRTYAQQFPSQMKGALNVAVAPIAERNDRGHIIDSDDASRLSDEVFDAIKEELSSLTKMYNPNLKYELRAPLETGSVRGDTDGEQSLMARRMANRTKADVIIFGNVTRASGRFVFAPKAYLSERVLKYAPELAGTIDLRPASADEAPGRSVLESNIVAQLETQIRGLDYFIFGLLSLGDAKYEQAARDFNETFKANTLNNAEGKMVLFQSLGNAYLQLKKLREARNYFDSALAIAREINQSNPRAHLGLGSVFYSEAYGNAADCTQVRSDPGLIDAIHQFQDALDLRFHQNSTDRADIRTKAHFGLGHAYMCLTVSELTRHEEGWSDRRTGAEQNLRYVTDEYEAEPASGKRLVNFAFEAYRELGFLYWRTGDIHRALNYYERVRELDKSDEGADDAVIAQLYDSLHQCESANENWVRAINHADSSIVGEYINLRHRASRHCNPKESRL